MIFVSISVIHLWARASAARGWFEFSWLGWCARRRSEEGRDGPPALGLFDQSRGGSGATHRDRRLCAVAAPLSTQFRAASRCYVRRAFFPYRFDWRFALLWTPALVRPTSDGVHLTTDRRFRATFGFFTLDTPLTNVAGAHVTEHYRWYTAIGPRLSFADDGLTFGTNRDRGVCVHFHQRVPAVLGFRPHSALTVTVEDCDGLVSALSRRGGPE